MRFVPTKTLDQQAALTLAASREQFGARAAAACQRDPGRAAEFGLVAAKGASHLAELLAMVRHDTTIPAMAQAMIAGLADGLAHVEARLADVEAQLRARHKPSATAQRLSQIPGIGPVIVSMLALKTPDPKAFPSGRDFAAWLGLTPEDLSTAGETRLGQIKRASDETPRSLLVSVPPPSSGKPGVARPSGPCRDWPLCSRASRRS